MKSTHTETVEEKQQLQTPPAREAHGIYRIGLAYGHFIYRVRWFVLALWVLIIAVSAFFAIKTPSLFSGGGIELKGSESVHVKQLLKDKLDAPASQAVVVFQSENTKVSDADYQKEISDLKDKLKDFPHLKNITTGGIGKDEKTTFLVLNFDADANDMQDQVPALRDKLPTGDKASPAHVYLTSELPLTEELLHRTQEDVERADLFALPVALVILIVVFGTLSAAAMPLLLAILAVVMALAIVYPIALNMEVSNYVLSVISIIGLGASIDYSLFIIRRFREELAQGYPVREAIAWTIATAGEAILFSGLLVIIGFVGLLLIGLGIITSIGIGGAAVIVAAVLAALTFLPALLSIVGHRVNSIRIPFLWKLTMPTSGDGYNKPGGFWHRLALGVMKRPFLTILIVCVILVGLGWPVLSMRIGTSSETMLPKTAPSRQGLEVLKQQFPDQFENQQIQIVAQTKDKSDVLTKDQLNHIADLSDWLKKQPHVKDVSSIMNPPSAPGSPALTKDQLIMLYTTGAYKQNPALVQFVESTTKDDLTQITVSSDTKTNTSEANDQITHLRNEGDKAVENITVHVGGMQAIYMDFDNFLYGNFPKAIIFIVSATFILLMLMFRSLLLPLKAVIMNALSISATYGVLVFIFQWGNFSNILGFTSNGFVDNIVPILLFCILFGLSMDYEVFLLSRVREEWLHTSNNTLAVARGLEMTGSVITNAALLFLVVTVSFIFTSLTVTKELGVGMTIAILVDATIVRSLLVPATMRLLGRWNWWLPGRPLPKEKPIEDHLS
ncbi:RND superfamily putative drug exporter [Thermosporothrix hazakensis]|jgi:RND superfamily putative drug exporter|uniref:RND superfamily putative drug exporter n=1 Tax=Thermosporothrix hazakensis TaxID=644383 RepID=A0A326TZQ5_THEHA|nr:MMPL family transporter [Thermosporothrix hazakensis]PZW22417.1 RND superfamily putative drug exporter [Thermosporothrix hazakensis]GCE49171.1 membrane protein [Thermosporothrix hazakensis]